MSAWLGLRGNAPYIRAVAYSNHRSKCWISVKKYIAIYYVQRCSSSFFSAFLCHGHRPPPSQNSKRCVFWFLLPVLPSGRRRAATAAPPPPRGSAWRLRPPTPPVHPSLLLRSCWAYAPTRCFPPAAARVPATPLPTRPTRRQRHAPSREKYRTIIQDLRLYCPLQDFTPTIHHL